MARGGENQCLPRCSYDLAASMLDSFGFEDVWNLNCIATFLLHNTRFHIPSGFGAQTLSPKSSAAIR